MIEDYKNGVLEQWLFQEFLTSAIPEDRVIKIHGRTVYSTIAGGGTGVSPRNSEFYIHPDDQARQDQGEQLRKIRVLWFGHVPSLEKNGVG